MFRFALFLLLGLIGISGLANNPEELGKVKWYRDLDEACQVSVQQNKPVLILFQEIPGCQTCKTYGRVVLSHPLIVETIETYFVPLAIYNNRRGKDASVLEYFHEPSWNNPVIRLVDPDKVEVQPRLDGNYTPSGLVNFLINGIRKSKRAIPDYLPLLYDELIAQENGVEKTTLSMYCFWTGEKELGNINGVVKTEAGFMDHREVVNVYYDPGVVTLEEIITKGKNTECADRIYVSDDKEKKVANKVLGTDKVEVTSSFRLDNEPKYFLSKTDFRRLPMTPMQAVKMNALIGLGKSPLQILSPRQLLMLNYLKENKSAVWSSHINDEKWQEKMFEAWEQLSCRI